jgi:hypothetical protein
MIVEESEASADYRLAVSGGIERYTKAWSHVVVIAGDAFDYAESLFRCGVDRRRGREERADFHVIADAKIEGELAVQFPTILSEKAHGNVVEGLLGISDALNVRGGDAQAVGLQPDRPGKRDAGDGIREAESGSGEAAEVDVPAEIELENLCFGGAELNKVIVAAELEGVLAADDADLVRKFRASLDAIHGGIWLAAEVGIAGNVDTNVAAAGKLGKTKMQAAASVLEARFIEIAIANDRVVLKSQIEVAGLRETGTRAGVLSEDLILRSRWLPSDERRRNANAKERIVAITPALIDAAGPQTGLLGDRVIAANGIESNIRSRQRCDVNASGGTCGAIIDGHARGACHRDGKLRSRTGVQKSAGGARRHGAEIYFVEGDARG